MNLLEEIKVLFDANKERIFTWAEIARDIVAGRDWELINSECADWYNPDTSKRNEISVFIQLKRIPPTTLSSEIRRRISDFHLKLVA